MADPREYPERPSFDFSSTDDAPTNLTGKGQEESDWEIKPRYYRNERWDVDDPTEDPFFEDEYGGEA